MTQPTIIDVSHEGIPDSESGRITTAMTLRMALAMARKMDWGDIGSARCTMSDGSELCVELSSAFGNRTGGFRLMASQRAVRYWWRDGLRKYRVYKL